ncbi:pleckstrin-like protein [Mycena albidolilacea]|uniref:Pleckstrin-like protein n=1 Tax=Mycena albidolilacea TaxID=1033008 RepID=A0AAD7F3A5_9AGAR|nr:pleckstrin-like protein [Mycena albidolilacea]
MSSIVPPPSPQEIHRKLSVHSMAGKSPRVPPSAVSGTESDSDTVLYTDNNVLAAGAGVSSSYGASVQVQPLLSSIAERRSASGGEDSEDEDADEEEGGWKTTVAPRPQGSAEESVIKAGYLWKKGERRKTWKKRWFVLRPAHLAYYKTAAEYQLLRLLDLSDVHSCTKVALKRHENTFGLVSPIRTFYLQAKNPGEVHDWVKAIDEARQALQAAAASSGSASNPIPIPRGRLRSNAPPPVTPSPPSHGYYMTSSDSEDNASPSGTRSYSISSQTRPTVNMGGTSPSAKSHAVDPAKTILSGYLMKCGSKRRNWRKRWFVLSGEQLVYSGSHMDTKPHRRFPFAEILDALEYDLPANRQNPALMSPPGPAGAPPVAPPSDEDANDAHTFKIVTTKRTLLLCAPSEEDEIKWLGAVRALIARRSGSGVVPGDSTKISDISPTASGMSSGGSGLITRVRRSSASGSGLPVEGSSQ